MQNEWTPDSWKEFPALQQPDWPDTNKLQSILNILKKRLPLVFPGEIEELKTRIGRAARGEMFLLQGGDCAERFTPSLEEVENKLKILMQMSVVLMYAAAKPVIKVGRIAGQYAKPRSKPTQEIDGKEMPNYFGDIVNRPEANEKDRTLNPKNMLDAYNFSVSTMNIVRALSTSGFADLHRVHNWNKEFIAISQGGKHYEEIADSISNALNFMKACGIEDKEMKSTDFFTSHEALLLDYESSLTKQHSPNGQWYDQSGHMLWIGDRTRQPDGAHIEFLRGVANPLGLKAGPSMKPDDLDKILTTLNPDNEWGRITLITRFGAKQIRQFLPELIDVVKKGGHNVLWSCDPMHGNIQSTSAGYKTRDFYDILSELRQFFDIHKEKGTIAGGVHLELTGDEVTECTGGAEQLNESHLEENYLTACDPRLNARQALEMAFLIAGELKE